MAETNWNSRAEQAQQTLDTLFWNDQISMYNIQTPCPNGDCNTIFHYWWMAHAVDVLIDGYLRTSNPFYTNRLSLLYEGLLERNGGVWPNLLYDDMEWMALAWLRAYQATGEDKYKQTVLTLWDDIKTGWNEHMGGGIAWHKNQLDYKNTPANAPAIILAARLYKAFYQVSDLNWAKKIYDWQKQTLVDPHSGFVWDGLNRTGDGLIDLQWEFTYCQGVFIGAGVELFSITTDETYLNDALRTFKATKHKLANDGLSVLPEEGDGDGGLFKGILVRYLGKLVAAQSARGNDPTEIIQFLEYNATTLWSSSAATTNKLFGVNWDSSAGDIVSLSTQLSGVKLIEMVANIERS